MSLVRAAAVVIGSSLLGSPLVGLYCSPMNDAEMACCRGDMSHCNMPGKTEDCCRKVPAGKESQTLGPKAEWLGKSRLGSLVDLSAVTSALPTAVQPVETAIHEGIAVRRPAEASPPRSPILRV